MCVELQLPGTVTVHDLSVLSHDDLPLLYAAIERVRQHQHVKHCAIWCNARTREGWLELLLQFVYDDGGKLTVGALQRTDGAPYEFHS